MEKLYKVEHKFDAAGVHEVLTPVENQPARPALPSRAELFQQLGPGAGLPRAAATRLVDLILALDARIAALETEQHINPTQIGVERR
jgi:hypothetical protein